MSLKILGLALAISVVLFSSKADGAGILDLFELDSKKVFEVSSAYFRTEQNTNRNCMCKGPACICCMNFNLTLVDLGGPGCVHMKYLSPDEGFSVNVSYGKNLLHSSKIKGSNSPPICLDLFSKFAQLCARFSELAPTSEGLRGCLQLEPKLLGDTQLEFPMGCFKSSPGGMEMDETAPQTTQENQSQEEEETSGSEEGVDPEAIIQIVNQTAEQGIAFLSSLLGISNKGNSTTTSATEETVTSTSAPAETTSRSSRTFSRSKHPNHL